MSRHQRSHDYLQQYLVEEMVEEYQEAHISRRELVRRVLLITGSIPATASLLLAAGCGSVATPAAPASVPTTPAAAPTTVVTGSAPTTSAATAAPITGTTTGTVATAATTAPSGATSGATSPSPGAAGTKPAVSAAAPAASGGVTVSESDPAIDAGNVDLPGQAGMLKGYRATPRGGAKAPGILVIHENRGLTEHIKDMTRRYAKAGYLAVAVDLVSRQGGTDKYPDASQVTGILGQANKADLLQDLMSGVTYLKSLPMFAGPKAGAVGYCFGGGLTWALATQSPDLAAAIPYYGPPPQPIEDVRKITAAVLAFYGETDQRITSNEPAIEAAMKQYGKTFEFKIYPGAGHAFNNDTGQSYNAAAAKDAYQRSLDWFAKYLKV